MANIKKSFNFRNGVQVDEDNLLVSSTGLVAIGKTVPTEALDVIGNVVISGVTSSVFTQTGVLTVTSLNPTEIIGAGVSIKSGIITAQGTGIVTYFGDARFLQGMPTSQWVDTDVGLGVSSIYNTGGTVGIGTTFPTQTLQVGGDPANSEMGVGISSLGNINASGIITASSFTGSITGTVTGNADSATLAASATALQNARNIGGVSFDGTADINLPGVNAAGTQDTSGTASNLSGTPSIFVTNIDCDGDLDVEGHSNFDNVSVAGVTTFSGTIEGISGQNKIPSLYSNQTDLPNPSTYHGMFAHVHATGRGYFAHASGWYELVNKESSGVVGTGTETYVVGSLSATDFGVGTASPANDIQLRKTGDTELQITSETGTAGLTLGRETGTNNTNNVEIRYGQDTGTDYGSAQAFDILNYGTGNFNYHLSANNSNAIAGDFHWLKGLNTPLMTLTGIGGSLGIGITVPSQQLQVLGSADISGNLNLGGDLTASSIVSNITGNVTGNLSGSVTDTSGTSSFYQVVFDKDFLTEVGEFQAQAIGIGVTMGNSMLRVNSGSTNRFSIGSGGNVGIKTDNVNGKALYVDGEVVVTTSLLVGSGDATSAVDFSGAGQGLTGAFANRMYMRPPTVDDTQKGNLTGMVGGAFIFNSTSSKLEFYDGSIWTPLEANSGGGEVNQNAFSNIAVSGQSNIVADAKQDTVTFVAGSNMTITTNAGGDEVTFASSGGGGGGSSLESRTDTNATTTSIAQSAYDDITIPTSGNGFALLKIAINAPAWVVLYTDDASRTADAAGISGGRSEGTDPTPGSGVLAEVSTTTAGASTFKMTPGLIGWNDDGTPAAQIYARVYNKRASTGSNSITVTLTSIKIEA
tara:strand:- start:858 stop:3449 length:2592 start_codon:yes stop_codon:yes gene_type:complete